MACLEEGSGDGGKLKQECPKRLPSQPSSLPYAFTATSRLQNMLADGVWGNMREP